MHVSAVACFRTLCGITHIRALACASCAVAMTVTGAQAQCGVPPKFHNQIGEPAQPAESVPEHSVLPSSLVHYIHLQNYLQPEWDQQKIAWPLLDIARLQGLNDKERFYWGQLNFMSFKAQEAYEIFGEFVERDDWYGWMARQRQAIMDTRAFERFDRLEENLKKERRDFKIRPEFASITGFAERALCGHWAGAGEHERAVALARGAARSTPRDAAYNPLLTVTVCYPSFEATGQAVEAFALAEGIRADLQKALSKRLKTAGRHAAYDAALQENIIEDRWYGRSLIAPYNYQNYKLERMISRLDRFLACRRDGRDNACAAN